MAREQQAAFDVGPRAGAKAEVEEDGATVEEPDPASPVGPRFGAAEQLNSGGCGEARRGLAAIRRRWCAPVRPNCRAQACEVLTQARAILLVAPGRSRRKPSPTQRLGARTRPQLRRRSASLLDRSLQPARWSRSARQGRVERLLRSLHERTGRCTGTAGLSRASTPHSITRTHRRPRTALGRSRTTAPRAERPWTRSRMSVIDVVNVVTCAANMADRDFDERERRKSSHRKWKQKLPYRRRRQPIVDEANVDARADCRGPAGIHRSIWMGIRREQDRVGPVFPGRSVRTESGAKVRRRQEVMTMLRIATFGLSVLWALSGQSGVSRPRRSTEQRSCWRRSTRRSRIKGRCTAVAPTRVRAGRAAISIAPRTGSRRGRARNDQIGWSGSASCPHRGSGNTARVGTDGDPQCVKSDGARFKGRKCCEKRGVDPAFMAAHNAPHNLFPADGEINGARGHHPFGRVLGEVRKYGTCDFEVGGEPKAAEPLRSTGNWHEPCSTCRNNTAWT